MGIYLDNSATTPLCEKAKEAMISAMEDCWGNPSSFHYQGIKAMELLEKSREEVAKKLSCSSDEIYFTSGGTQGNNIAVFGAVNAMKRRGNKIVTTAVEHPSIANAVNELERQGFDVVRLKVGADGVPDKAEMVQTIDEKTILVTMMLVNNESGSIMPVKMLRKIINMKNSPALIHCDAVQGFGKIDINASSLGADMITVSSHKIHGPKGAGALYIKKGTRIVSTVFGGEQEKGIVPGTHAMPAIAGFGAAAGELPKSCGENLEKAKKIRDRLVNGIEKIDGASVNSPHDALPYITNISLKGIPSQPMITFLSHNGICVSGGSACARGHRSGVLSAMGLSTERIDTAIRISISRYTTEDEIDELLRYIKIASETLRKKNG